VTTRNLESHEFAQGERLHRLATASAMSVTHFCLSHGISRALFYLLVKDGQGPQLMRVRGRTLISVEAACDWRRRMERPPGSVS
jgi:hypothetical protein